MLSPGDPVPVVAGEDVTGRAFSTEQYRGRVLVLSFFRYASCPMCLLRIAELAQWTTWIEGQGGAVVCVFHSPARAILRHTRRMSLPMRLLADPDRRLYEAFGVGSSWAGVGASLLKPSFLLDFARATARGHFGGAIDGEFARMPADFVVAPQGILTAAHYGGTIGDHISRAELQEAIAAARPVVVGR